MPHLLACLRSDKEARTQAPDSCHVVLFLCSPFKFADGTSVSFVRHGTPARHITFCKMRPVQQCGHLSTASGPYILTEKEEAVEEGGVKIVSCLENKPCKDSVEAGPMSQVTKKKIVIMTKFAVCPPAQFTSSCPKRCSACLHEE